jgi:surfactin synthase thioesterase subunit
MFPGDHFFINSAQPLLLETLGRELEQIINHKAHRSTEATAIVQ